MARFFAYLLQRRIVWKSLAILVLEVAIVIYQKKNSSLNVVELWVTKETDESEVQSALRKYQQQGIFVCIFRSGTKDCVELTQELLKLTLDNDTFENTGKSRFFERRTSRVLY